MQHVGELGVENLRREWSKTGFVGCHFAGQTQGEQRAPVVATGKRNDGGALGIGAGNFDSVFDRFGASGQEQGLLGKGTWSEGVDAFGEFYISVTGQQLRAGVGVNDE